MQVDASISAFSSGNRAVQMTPRNAGSSPASGGSVAAALPVSPDLANPVATLTEPSAGPAFGSPASGGGYETAVLKESAGTGSVPVRMAAAAYVLNLSFDIQARALDLLA